MTAVACLRVLFSEDDPSADAETLAPLISRLGGAFLETRWAWPRRFGVIAPCAFALADPRTEHLDPHELQELAVELHDILFGETGEGEVCLIALEGRQDDIMRFATADAALLHEMIARGGGAVEGRLSVITPTLISALKTLDTKPRYPHDHPALQSGPPAPAPVTVGDLPGEQNDRGFRGVYHPGREMFIGSVVVARPYAKAPLWSVVDGLRDMPTTHTVEHDLACIETACEALSRPGGVLFVPINFSSIVYGSTRRVFDTAIAQLPIAQRNRLAAAIYETPRDPSWSAMSQLKTFLGPRFAFVDLQVADPDFAVDKLPEDGVVTSVSFALPEGDEKLRIAAASRFMGKLHAYRRRRVWPALSNVRSRRELAAGISLKSPFITGRAVSATLAAPPDANHRPHASLPMTAATAAS